MHINLLKANTEVACNCELENVAGFVQIDTSSGVYVANKVFP